MYQNWEHNFVDKSFNENHALHGIPMFCSGATHDDMFPDCCKGSLCHNVLEQLGCTPEIMKDNEGFCNALYFFQLVFPIGDTTLNKDDPCFSFFSEVTKYMNIYVGALGLGSGYGHDFKSIQITKLVRYYEILVQFGVLGGNEGAILQQFKKAKYN